MTEKITTGASYMTSGGLVLGGLAINDWVAIVGIALGVATFVVNLIYKHKHLELERRRDEKT